MEMRVANIKVGPRFRKDLGDVGSLARSIERLGGLLQPVVVTPDAQLIAGVRRLEALKLLGWEMAPVRVVDLDDPLQAEHDENEEHKPFTTSERVAIADALRDRIGSRQGQRTDLPEETLPGAELQEYFPEVRPGEQTRATAAKKAGFGNETTYRQAKSVTANGSPELVEAMDAGDVSVSAAATLAGLPKEEQREVLSRGPDAATERAREMREGQARNREAEKSRHGAGRGERNRGSVPAAGNRHSVFQSR